MSISSYPGSIPIPSSRLHCRNGNNSRAGANTVNVPHSSPFGTKREKNARGMRMSPLGAVFAAVFFMLLAAPVSAVGMDIGQTISDGAQSSTIAFDGFAFVTGNLNAQSFFPPGKVADYFGFQYLRDNAPGGIGHNTDFLTNCALNVLYILSDSQLAALKALAAGQVDQVNLYAYKRFPLMKAFNRELSGDIPAGTTGLSPTAVKAASSDLYALDGKISFDRAVGYASVINTLDASQKSVLDAMKAGGFAAWTVSDEMRTAVSTRMRGLSHDVSVGLMTYAGDIFAWYAGSLEADVYFCPERQGTYFGSFYVKDAPAVGHPGYQISVGMTADVGHAFLNSLADTRLDTLITGLVDSQRDNLYAGVENILQVRTDISSLLRSLLVVPAPTDQAKAEVLAQVLEKSRIYGELDGAIVYSYATAFAKAYKAMNATQKTDMAALRTTVMSGTYNGVPFDFSVCETPFLYSAEISDTSVLAPYVSNTDYLFGNSGNSTVEISVSPLTVTVRTGMRQQFTAQVSGTSNNGVTWLVNGVAAGNATVGKISATGLYSAPKLVPNPATVSITAIPKADPTVSAGAAATICIPPKAGFSFSPGAPLAGLTVNFKDASTGTPASWSWNFGDGSTSASRNPTHVYSKAGKYRITLVVGNAAGSGTLSKTITVSAASSRR